MTDSNPYATPNSAVEVDSNDGYAELNYHNARGRIGRMRYIAWSAGLGIIFYLVMLVAGLILGLAGASSFLTSSGSVNPDIFGSMTGIAFVVVTGILYIAMFVYMFRFTIKRCHDFNVSGWLSLLIFVPLLPLIFWFIPGTDGENRYGLPTPPNTTGVKVLFWLTIGFVALAIIGMIAAIVVPMVAQG